MAAQAVSAIICPMALQTLREILHDVDPGSVRYSDARLVTALRANRETVFVRNPLLFVDNGWLLTNAIFAYGSLPSNWSNIEDSFLIPEPGQRSYQAKRHLRNWDSQSAVTVYRYGQVRTITTDYLINYSEGRVTFTSDIGDYEPIQASFNYYKLYHAARQCLMSRLALGNQLISWTEQDGTSEHYGTIKEAIAAMNALISDFLPGSIPFGKRIV